MMEDYLGTEINIGDPVLVVRPGALKTAHFVKGEVVGFHEGNIGKWKGPWVKVFGHKNRYDEGKDRPPVEYMTWPNRMVVHDKAKGDDE